MYESNDFNLIHLFFQTMLLEASVSTEGQVFNIFLDNDLCSYTSVTKKKKRSIGRVVGFTRSRGRHMHFNFWSFETPLAQTF